MKIKNKTGNTAALVDRTQIKVRFSEVDSMHIVWHGEYIRYFEDGRVSFGDRYGLGYMDVYEQGYMIPMVELDCQFKQSLTFGDEAIIETRFINTEAAKICFEYTIYRASDQVVVATGRSTQVFINLNRELELANPAFYLEWKKKWAIE